MYKKSYTISEFVGRVTTLTYRKSKKLLLNFTKLWHAGVTVWLRNWKTVKRLEYR